MFHNILTVLSFPFWFFGSVFMIAFFFGTVKIKKVAVHGAKKIPALVIGVVCLAIAWFLVYI